MRSEHSHCLKQFSVPPSLTCVPGLGGGKAEEEGQLPGDEDRGRGGEAPGHAEEGRDLRAGGGDDAAAPPPERGHGQPGICVKSSWARLLWLGERRYGSPFFATALMVPRFPPLPLACLHIGVPSA